MSKKVKLGNVISHKTDRGNNVYITLGQKNPKNPQYNTTVEITVKDSTGKVVAKQTDGFIEVNDPRTQPEQLLSANLISEEQAEKMRERVTNLDAAMAKTGKKLTNELFIKRT